MELLLIVAALGCGLTLPTLFEAVNPSLFDDGKE